MIEVIESALQKAAGEGMDEFIQVFTDKYKEHQENWTEIANWYR